MTWEQYWDGDCEMPKYYRKAFELQKHRKNEELWLQGAYVYEAIIDIAPVLHAFAKKGTRPEPYASEPYALTSADVEEKKQRKAEAEYKKKKATVEAWASAVNNKLAKKEVESHG